MTDPAEIAAKLTKAQRDEIPHGWYCYQSNFKFDENGRYKIKLCPHWKRLPDEHAECRLLNYKTEFPRDLLWDQVKICDINPEMPDDIAEYLSPRQKALILSLGPEPVAVCDLDSASRRNARYRDRRLVQQEKTGRHPYSFYFLTPLGLAVRAILKEQPQ